MTVSLKITHYTQAAISPQAASHPNTQIQNPNFIPFPLTWLDCSVNNARKKLTLLSIPHSVEETKEVEGSVFTTCVKWNLFLLSTGFLQEVFIQFLEDFDETFLYFLLHSCKVT